MSARIAILVEGATEAALKPNLRAFLEPRLPGQMPRLDFVPQDGRLPKSDKLRHIVARLLATSDAVIALTDVYTGTSPPDFNDAADARTKMRNWVGAAEARFHPHAAQHDFEAWLLPYWTRIRRIAGSDRQTPSANPETVNHMRPPSALLADIFRTGQRGRSYSKTRDAAAILRGQDLAVSAAQCPEFKAFLNTMLRLSGGQEPECGVLRDLAVHQRDELVRARRLIEPRVQILEQALRDHAEHVQLVERADQKSLMQHGRQQRIGDPVPRHVDHRNPGHPLAAIEIGHDIGPAVIAGLLHPRLEIEPLLEVHVDDVVPAHRAAQRKDAAPDIDPGKPRQIPRLRHQISGDVLEVVELAGELLQQGRSIRIGWQCAHVSRNIRTRGRTLAGRQPRDRAPCRSEVSCGWMSTMHVLEIVSAIGGLVVIGFILNRIRMSRSQRSSFDAGTVSVQWLTEQRVGARKDRFS